MVSSGLLRIAALFSVPAGALGSIGYMLHVGQHNESRILLLLFAGWVLAPFVTLGWAEAASKRWTASAQTKLHVIMLVLSLASLLLYGTVAWGPPRPKPAAFFLLMPLASLLLIAFVAWASARKEKPDGQA